MATLEDEMASSWGGCWHRDSRSMDTHQTIPEASAAPECVRASSVSRDMVHSSQPRHTSADRRNKRRRYDQTFSALLRIVLSIAIFLPTVSAAFIRNFENCLPDNILDSTPPNKLLQFNPLWVDARFIQNSGFYNLNVTIYGNVSGQSTQGAYPPPSSPNWDDPSNGFGKIVNISASTNTYTTLSNEYNVLSYTPASDAPTRFCESVVNAECPIAPVFDPLDRYDYNLLPAYSIEHRFESSYGFSTLSAISTVRSGDRSALQIACVAAQITPALSATLSGILSYLPVAILAIVAIATLLAATVSPWGTLDIFRWTSNYGRDEDLIRLVTPGFGDALQYIQFIILAGSLSLAYPGYFQPVVRNVAWSSLMFNESFVGNVPTLNPVDGLYATNSTYGLGRMSQLVGVADFQDLWANTIIWTLVIVAIFVVVSQIGFLIRSAVRKIGNNPAEDLRHKNWPFTAGNVVRIVCNFFLLPLVSLSMFQLVLGGTASAIVTAFAVILLVLIILFALWILRLMLTTKPRSHLFDDLPTVLLYGPLYNTYSDDAAPFALVPAFITFMRGVAIGAVQQAGTAQLVILAICEVVMILTLFAFRPFHPPTSMNAYHAFFSTARLAVILLMVSFAPKLGVTEGTKGWIGYVILLIHAIVLVFGFFLNAILTIIEVSARLLGAAGEAETGAASRGGLVKILGVRELSKRKGRQSPRNSQHSRAAFLTDDTDAKSAEYAQSLQFGGRSRSMSASSAMMLNGRRGSDPRISGHLERTMTSNTSGDAPPEYGYGAVGPRGSMSNPRRPDLTLRTAEPADPYYRPPRPRRHTGELMTPGAKSREPRGSGDWTGFASSPEYDQRDPQVRTGSWSPQNAPAPAYMKAREGSETDLGQHNQDYAVREVDYYYGVRGPALSSQGGTRKLKTGPADPVGPASMATGWFKGMFGGKKKESGKGFEVVRSSRAFPRVIDEESPKEVESEEPYRDSPVSDHRVQEEAYVPGERTRSSIKDDQSSATELSPVQHMSDRGSAENNEAADDNELADNYEPTDNYEPVPERPPSIGLPLDALDSGLDFRPSRWSSRVSRQAPIRLSSGRQAQAGAQAFPMVPPRSPRRPLSQDLDQPPGQGGGPGLPTIRASDDFSRPSRTSSPRVPFSTDGADDRTRRPSAVSYISDDERPAARGERSGSDALQPTITNTDRPTSFGFVNQFRAWDSIQPPRLGENVYAGSSAEVINSTPRRSRERDSFSAGEAD